MYTSSQARWLPQSENMHQRDQQKWRKRNVSHLDRGNRRRDAFPPYAQNEQAEEHNPPMRREGAATTSAEGLEGQQAKAATTMADGSEPPAKAAPTIVLFC